MSKKRPRSKVPPSNNNNIAIFPRDAKTMPKWFPCFDLVSKEILRPFDSKGVYCPQREVDYMWYFIIGRQLMDKIVTDEKGMVLGGEEMIAEYHPQSVPVMKIRGFSLSKKRAFHEAYAKFNTWSGGKKS